MGEYTRHLSSLSARLQGKEDENGTFTDNCCCADCEGSGQTRLVPDSGGTTCFSVDAMADASGIGFRFGAGLFDDGTEEGEQVSFTYPSGLYTLTDTGASVSSVFIAWDKWLEDMWDNLHAAPFPIRVDKAISFYQDTYIAVGSWVKCDGTGQIEADEQDAGAKGLLDLRITYKHQEGGTSTTESEMFIEIRDQSENTWHRIMEAVFDMPTCGNTLPIDTKRIMSTSKDELGNTAETDVDLDTWSDIGEAISEMFEGGMFVATPCALDAVQDHNVDFFGVFVDPDSTDIDITAEVTCLAGCFNFFGIDIMKVTNDSGSTVSNKTKTLEGAGAYTSGDRDITLDNHAFTRTYYLSSGCTGSTTDVSDTYDGPVEIYQCGVFSGRIATGSGGGGYVGELLYNTDFDFHITLDTDLDEDQEYFNLVVNLGDS